MTRAELGKELFFDKRLSSDKSVSCASCHKPEKAFTNGKKLANGVFHREGDRNVPTLLNRNGTEAQFWDMRVPSLEAQVKAVMANTKEMGGEMEVALTRLNADPSMNRKFHEVFGGPATEDNLAAALAAYERTLRAPPSPYDRFIQGDAKALSASARRGKDLFFEKFKCASCHKGENFSDEKLNVRCYPFVANLDAIPGPKFKTPTLRNLKYTAPYMHNGALATLEEAVEFYTPSVELGDDAKPKRGGGAVFATTQDKKDLVEFLNSLSSNRPYMETTD